MRISFNMRRSVKCLIVFLLMMSNMRVEAQDTSQLDLKDILRRVETEYPDVSKYQNVILSLKAKAEGATAWMPPTATFGLSRFPYDPSMLTDEGPMNQAGLMFAVEQMIPNPWKLSAKKQYLQSLQEIEEEKLAWTKNTLRWTTKYFYYQRIVSEIKLGVVAQSRELIQLLISTSENKYPYNQTDLNTIFKAKAKLAELENMEAMIESQIVESNIGLNSLMNRDIQTNFGVDTTLRLNSYESISQASDSSVSRSDILALESEIVSMGLNRDYMNSFSKPDFGIRLEHMNMFGMPNEYSVMGMVTIPIAPWSSSMYTSDVQSMEYTIMAMRQEQQSMQLMANRMINEKLTMYKYEKKRLKNFAEAIIPLYVKNFETSILAFQQNTGNMFVLLDAWEMLLMKKMEYYDTYLKVLRLEADYEYETEN